MAAVSGDLILASEAASTLILVGPISAGNPHYSSVNLVSGNVFIAGDFVRGDIDSDGRDVVGGKILDYVDDFYYRFHLIPWSIDFGYIITTVTEYFTLWNAYFVSKVCTAIN